MIKLIPSADGPSASRVSGSFRKKRFARFAALLDTFEKPVSIVDVGGTVRFWEEHGLAGGSEVDVTLINLRAEDTQYANVRGLAGDATDLSEFADKSFDIAFSNSVIEHLFTIDAQHRMASEMRRVAHAYWVQTPNYWFPIEPHFYVPGWQWLPMGVRTAMLRHWRCGCRGPCPDPEVARRQVAEVRLLRKPELKQMFSDATIEAESVCGLAKSWLVHGGFATAA